MRDDYHNSEIVHLGNVTLSGTTAAQTNIADLGDYDSATIIAVINTVTDAGTAQGFTLTVHHSDTTAAGDFESITTFDSVSGATFVRVTADNADNTVGGGVGYNGGKRYLRVSCVGTTGTDADVTLLAMLGHAHLNPVAFVGEALSAT